MSRHRSVMVSSLVVFSFVAAAPLLGQPAPANKAKFVIKPGEGLEKCAIGMSIDKSIALLGEPTSRKDFEAFESVRFRKNGVAVHNKDGKIIKLYFHFRHSPDVKWNAVAFDGVTDKGIGFWSTIPEVINAYGKPNQFEQPQAEFAEDPEVISLRYDTLGIEFSFFDNQLTFIQTYAPMEKKN